MANRSMMIIVGLGLMRDSVIGTGRDLQVTTPTATVSGIATGMRVHDHDSNTCNNLTLKLYFHVIRMVRNIFLVIH